MIRQLFLLSLILLACAPTVGSQQQDVSVKENDLYYRALYASLEKMNASWGKFADSEHGTRIPIDYHNFIVEKKPDITDRLPSQLGAYRVEYLDSQGLIDRYRKLRKEFAILVVYPMDNDGARSRISFNLYWISYKKRGLFFGLSDWSQVYFRYDCEKREYVIDEVKLGGI